METILVKIFATALALSQVTTTPDTVKTQFDRVRDQERVAQLLHAGCAHMRKAFEIEDINLEDLIATAMDDPQAVAGESKVFHGINFADLQTACRQSTSATSSTTTTRQLPICPITPSSRSSSFQARVSFSSARANASRRCSR